MVVPVPDKLLTVEKEINKLVNEAIGARREATRLLEAAKKTVEDLITGGGNGSRGWQRRETLSIRWRA